MRIRSVSVSGYAKLASCLVAALIVIAQAGISIAGSATLPAGFTDVQVAGALDEPVGLALVPDASPLPARVLFVEQRTARVRMTLGEEVVTTF